MRSLSREAVSRSAGALVPGLRFERRFPTWKDGVLPLDEPGPAASKPARVIHARAGFSYEARISQFCETWSLIARLAILVYSCGYVGRSAVISPRVEPMSLMSGIGSSQKRFRPSSTPVCDIYGSTHVPIGYAPISTRLGRSAQDLARYGSHGIRSNTGQLVSRQARWNLPWFL